MNGDDLSAMIKKIIENPEFAGMVSELRGDGDKEGASQEMMAKLPEVMAMVQPMLGGSGEKSESSENENKEDKRQDSRPPMIHPGLKYDKNKAEKLMYALKPYMNSSRCDMIDKCISVLQLSDLVSAFGGIEGLLGNK